jgi:hypothetical protein
MSKNGCKEYWIGRRLLRSMKRSSKEEGFKSRGKDKKPKERLYSQGKSTMSLQSKKKILKYRNYKK